MIADAVKDALIALFMVWRRSVTRVWRAGTRLCRTLGTTTALWASTWKMVLGHLVSAGPALPEADSRYDVVSGFGVLAFVAGALVSVGIALGDGDSPSAIAGVMAAETAWAAARFGVLALVLRERKPRTRIGHAYLTGLAPYALAVTPPLRLAALALSAILTARGLRDAGFPARDVRTATAWAFGGQALASLLGALASGVLAVIALT